MTRHDRFEKQPILSIHGVSPEGAVSLIAANIPYGNLQWTRRFSSVGEFSVELACPCPVDLPGRYLVTLSGHEEVGVVEKDEPAETVDGASCRLSGRFAECLWDRYRLGVGEASRGADWRQAVTAALSAWHMPDLPPLAMGEGTAAPTGRSYAVAGDAGSSAMELIYSAASANGSRPLVSYDRDSDASSLAVALVGGVDRTRGQSANPVWVFSLGMATASEVSRSGDYSVACSTVLARAERDGRDGTSAAVVERTVAVPGFDPALMWAARVFEDVSSLLGDGEDPTPGLVDVFGGLRAYDHMPEVAMDCSAMPEGYRSMWDLGDMVEVEMPSAGVSATARVEEVREVHKPTGAYVEATVGTKRISRVKRALAGRR